MKKYILLTLIVVVGLRISITGVLKFGKNIDGENKIEKSDFLHKIFAKKHNNLPHLIKKYRVKGIKVANAVISNSLLIIAGVCSDNLHIKPNQTSHTYCV